MARPAPMYPFTNHGQKLFNYSNTMERRLYGFRLIIADLISVNHNHQCHPRSICINENYN